MLNEDLRKKIEGQVKGDRIVVYMKGTAQMPQCGFSAQVVHILNKHGKTFKTYNILEDDALRQGMKEFTNWPTFPQVYVDGKFVGGCDIVSDLEQRGELKNML